MCVRRPTPDTVSFATRGSACTSPSPHAATGPAARPAAAAACDSGTVKEIAAWPACETFCTIMSTVTPSAEAAVGSPTASNRSASTPGRSGTGRTDSRA